MLNKCAIEIVSLSIIATFDGNSKNIKKYAFYQHNSELATLCRFPVLNTSGWILSGIKELSNEEYRHAV